MRTSRTGLIFGIVAGLIVALGAGAGIYLAANRHPAADAGPFADLDTVDPCSVVTPGVFAGPADDVHIQPAALDSCTVKVLLHDVNGGYQVNLTLDARAGRLARAKQATATDRDGLHVATVPQTAGTHHTCDRYVYRDDDAGVSISAQLTGDSADASGQSKPGYDPCTAADHAVTAVLDAVTRHSVTHIAYPKDSAGSLDLCGVLTVADATRVIGSKHLLSQSRHTRHDCDFDSPTVDRYPGISVRATLETTDKRLGDFVTGEALLAMFGTVDGHETTDTADSTYPLADETVNTCTASTAVKTWDDWPGAQTFGGSLEQARGNDDDTSAATPALAEVVTVTVVLPHGGTTQQCGATLALLVAQVWPQLPAATQL